jgi:NAD(P)-dependent dehydrogenase (short-subunit alcohol dehydrogenase family)
LEGLLEGKVVVITGAGSGVGRAASLLFSRHGAKVVAADLNADTAAETIEQVKAEGGTAVSVECNVAEPQEVDAAVALAVTEFGRLDVMYNNAGIGSPSKPDGRQYPFIETTPEHTDRLVSINISGVMNGCQSAIRQFLSQGGGGNIVNTASVAGLIGLGGVLYGVTKGGITSLTRTLALEVARHNIRVNSVCPAAMRTNFFGPNAPTSEEHIAFLDAMHPLGRTIDPMECASAALFFASCLSTNITGVNLPVDGGLSAGRIL